MKYSPRFVNFDECMLLAYSGDISIDQSRVFNVASHIFEIINRREVTGLEWLVTTEQED